MAEKSARGRVILVSNRLPATIVEEAGKLTASRSMGGLATALTSVFEKPNTLWVGWTGVRRQLTNAELASLPLPAGMVPVNLTPAQVHSFYDRVANGNLWPTFHHFVPKKLFTETHWKLLLQATRRFAKAVLKAVGPEDVIWIHDYHLIALPGMLRKAGLKNRIGFFLHIPFPEHQFFSALPHHADMLASLSQADVLGFQTERDAERFRQAVATVNPGLALPEHLRGFPIGIDYTAYHSAAASPKVQKHADNLAAAIGNKRVIVSISRLDYTKGIIAQLQAVERLLTAIPAKERQNIVYRVVVAPSREAITEYRQLKRQIDRTVVRINKRFETSTWQPIRYAYRTLDFHEVVAHLQVADIFLATPIIDGMNLLAKEYIAARQGDQGVLVLSNNTGASVQLHDALLVNPTNIQQIADALHTGLTMPPAERKRRWQALTANVRDENVCWWATGFLDALGSSASLER